MPIVLARDPSFTWPAAAPSASVPASLILGFVQDAQFPQRSNLGFGNASCGGSGRDYFKPLLPRHRERIVNTERHHYIEDDGFRYPRRIVRVSWSVLVRHLLTLAPPPFRKRSASAPCKRRTITLCPTAMTGLTSS
jgi:hypothetical protein